MNILYHHRTQGKGVEGVHIREMIRAWENLGHRVEVVSPPGVDHQEVFSSRKDSLLRRIYRFFSSHLPEIFFEFMEIAYNQNGYSQILKKLDEKEFDFIYERYAIFNWSSIRAARRREVPILLEINYTASTPLNRKRSSIMKPLARYIDGLIFRNVDIALAISTYIKDQLIHSYNVPAENIVVLTNAADPDYFTPRLDGSTVRQRLGIGNKKIIGFVGWFDKIRGLDLLIDALGIVTKTVREAAALLIGDGPEKPFLLKQIKRSRLENNVFIQDYVNHSELPSYIATFDIAVLPDSNEFGSPMKMYEYMAVGKPIVAPELGPITDGVRNGVEGLLFKRNDIQDFARVLIKLLVDEPLCKRLGQNAREKVLHCHTWEKNGQTVVELQSKAIRKRKKLHAQSCKGV